MNEKNNKKKSGFSPVGIIVVLLLAVIGSMDGGNMETLIPVIVALGIGLVIVAVIVSTAKAAGKNAAQRGAARPAAPVRPGARPVSRAQRPQRAEEAIHCQHKSGKEKYLDQLDSFLANGIIDKAEYRVLRERYSKLEIDDSYHG